MSDYGILEAVAVRSAYRAQLRGRGEQVDVPQKQRRGASAPEPEPELLVPRSKMDQEIANRLDQGRQLLERPIRTNDDFDSLRDDFRTWDEYNEQLLTRRFSTARVANEYRRVVVAFGGRSELRKELEWLTNDITRQIRKLDSIRLQLELYESEVQDDMETPAGSSIGHKVFIVHGHDGDTKLQVAEFLQKITGERPVILHEQADSGKTVIEKFEAHASEAGFIVVLLTSEGLQRSRT